MALSITPGYDFSVNEVPTRAKFLQQALGVQIGGIPIDRIQESLQAIVFGDTTGASGGTPPAEGWIWVDPQGNRVVQTKAFPGYSGPAPLPSTDSRVDVRMWRAAGGWETNRHLTQGNSSGFDIILGQHMWFQGTSFRASDARQDMDQHFTPWGAMAHAADSPASNARVVSRGMIVARVNTQVTEILLRTHRPGGMTQSPGALGFSVLNQFDAAKAHYAGTVMGPALGSSTVSGGNTFPYASMWLTLRNMGKS